MLIWYTFENIMAISEKGPHENLDDILLSSQPCFSGCVYNSDD